MHERLATPNADTQPAARTVRRSCACGDACPSCRTSDPVALSSRFRIGPRDDAYEREADRVADAIVAGAQPARAEAPHASAADPHIANVLGHQANVADAHVANAHVAHAHVANAHGPAANLANVKAPDAQRPEPPGATGASRTSALVRTAREPQRAADDTLRTAAGVLRRQAEDDEEEMLQAKPEVLRRQTMGEEDDEEMLRAKPAGAAFRSPGAVAGAAAAVAGGGRPLAPSERAFFEPRFGQGLSHVRLHTDLDAGRAARRIGARAYTLGHHIAFAPGSFDSATTEGRRLMAHELTHTLQAHDRAPRTLRRAVAASSTCPPSVHGAPADPIAAIEKVDVLAEAMARNTSDSLLLEALTFTDPKLGPSPVSTAYKRWFGGPQATPDGKFLSRFEKKPFATKNEAIRHELLGLSERFQHIYDWLAQGVRYRCAGNTALKIPGCTPTKCSDIPGKDAFTCPTGSHTMGLCPSFWSSSTDLTTAALIIHETVHPLFHVSGHPAKSPAGRARNPYCFQVMALEVHGMRAGTVAECPPLPTSPVPGVPPGLGVPGAGGP